MNEEKQQILCSNDLFEEFKAAFGIVVPCKSFQYNQFYIILDESFEPGTVQGIGKEAIEVVEKFVEDLIEEYGPEILEEANDADESTCNRLH